MGHYRTKIHEKIIRISEYKNLIAKIDNDGDRVDLETRFELSEGGKRTIAQEIINRCHTSVYKNIDMHTDNVLYKFFGNKYIETDPAIYNLLKVDTLSGCAETIYLPLETCFQAIINLNIYLKYCGD